MPLMFSVMFFFFPSGLLYWLTNNILSIAQQWIINKRMGVRLSSTCPSLARLLQASKRDAHSTKTPPERWRFFMPARKCVALTCRCRSWRRSRQQVVRAEFASEFSETWARRSSSASRSRWETWACSCSSAISR